jgi:uncharacterized protein involved in type VI secretion and phage assembly
MTGTALAHGVTLGVVSNTADETGMGLIKVKFGQKGQEIESDWIQIMSGFAGPQRGAFFLPELDDSALLAFADGDASKPYVLGFLWNGKFKPPVAQADQQNVRTLKTRSGSTILFDDSDENGKIVIVDKDQNQIQIDTANKKITIDSKGDMDIKATGKLTISAAEVLIQTGDSVQLSLSQHSMDIGGGGALKLSAQMIDLN